MQPRIALLWRNLSACSSDRMRWRRVWENAGDFNLAIAPTSITAHTRRCCAEHHGNCVSSERLYRECERSSRDLAQRRDGHADDPIRRARWTAAS